MKKDNELPCDGKTFGEIQVRGPFIVGQYFKNVVGNSHTKDGWFKTGDVATIDSEGYMKIVDRTKDVIKSGGEWISSVELETLIMSHPKVSESAVVAVPDKKFSERPVALVVLKKDQNSNEEEIIEFLKSKVAKFWLPDKIYFVREIPKTSVGKFDKKVIRERLVQPKL